MSMSAATLATELLNLTPTATEAEAITALTDAYSAFASGAESNGVSISAAGVSLGSTAMSAALTGMSVSNAGRAIIPAAVAAFWVGVAGGLSTSFTGATAIVPPPHAGFSSDFTDLMDTNTSGSVSLSAAMSALADLMHDEATTGGTVTFPGPTTAPIT